MDVRFDGVSKEERARRHSEAVRVGAMAAAVGALASTALVAGSHIVLNQMSPVYRTFSVYPKRIVAAVAIGLTTAYQSHKAAFQLGHDYNDMDAKLIEAVDDDARKQVRRALKERRE